MSQLKGLIRPEVIYQSKRTKVYRAIRESDQQMIVIKTCNEPAYTTQTIVRYEHEACILKAIDHPCVVKLIELLTIGGQPHLIVKDGAMPLLTQVLKNQRFTVRKFLRFAIKLTDAIGAIHSNQIIYLDLNPDNILYDFENNELMLFDFDSSHTLSTKNKFNHFSEMSHHRLKYASPEETGRMNRSVDHRSDLYSLGILFYEILTGKVPFDSSDPLEIIHQHMAIMPPSPQTVDSRIPLVIAQIVLKLLNKAAEDRYQSAWGLKADLEKCLSTINSNDQIALFTLGRFDIPSRFVIPGRLYGREKEIATIMTAFERTCLGIKQILLVAGYSGIGKTSVIKEMYQPITHAKGYFIRGKFDQLHREKPLSAILQAIGELIKYILSEDELSLKRWRQELTQNLGSNGGVIAELVPDIELVIGPQSKPIPLDPTEAQNRFNLVFLNFLRTFCQPEHPLVLFLDDLQWMDLASVSLLEQVVKDQTIHHVLMIGAYRDNEVTPEHHLFSAIDQLKKYDVTVQEICLTSLGEQDICHLIGDTLVRSYEEVMPLAALVTRKTDGNPFFTEEFLKLLYKKRLLCFNHETLLWDWNLSLISSQNITDNVVELMARKISSLPQRTQYLLRLVAALGNEVKLDKLAVAAENSRRETAEQLKPAVEEGLLDPIGDDYKLVHLNLPAEVDKLNFIYRFAHDRIQQAAYSLIEPQEVPLIHLKLGRLLMHSLAPEQHANHAFDLAKHFNLALDLIHDSEEKAMILRINLTAARKARVATAYFAAYSHLEVARRLLPKDSWQSDYELTLEVYQQICETSYLMKDFEKNKHFAGEAMAHARNPIDLVPIYESLMLSQYSVDIMGSIDVAIGYLKRLGVSMPRNPGVFHVLLYVLRTKMLLAGKKIPALAGQKKMVDPQHLAVTTILPRLGSLAYLTRPNLWVLSVLAGTQMGIRYGNSGKHPLAYVGYGVLISSVLGEIERGYQFGQLGLNLLKKMPIREAEARVLHCFHAFLQYWYEPIDLCINNLDRTHIVGLETGEIEFACHSANLSSFYSFLACPHVAEVRNKVEKYHKIICNLSQSALAIHTTPMLQALENLMKGSADPTVLAGTAFNESDHPENYFETPDKSINFFYHLIKAVLCYMFERYDEGLFHIEKARSYAQNAIGSYAITVTNFYHSLLLLAANFAASPAKKAMALFKVSFNQRKLAYYAKLAPCNFKHKYLLVEAEKARFSHHHYQAMELYNEAVSACLEARIVNEHALILERAASFHLSTKNSDLASVFLQKALMVYERQGNRAKVNHLTGQHKASLEHFRNNLMAGLAQERHTLDANSINLAALRKSLIAIAEERDYHKMAQRIIDSSIELTGAQHGCLFVRTAPGVFAREAQGGVTDTYDQVGGKKTLDVSFTALNYVRRSMQYLVIDNAQTGNALLPGLDHDEIIIKNKVLSLLCMPIVIGSNQEKEMVAILYLENNAVSGAFTTDRLEVLEMIAMAAGGRIEIARKAQDLQSMLLNIKQGIMTILPDGVVHGEYSRYLSRILDTECIAGNNVMDLIFLKSNLSQDRLSQIETFIGCTIGESRISYEINRSLEIHEMEFIQGNSVKILELEWEPITNKHGMVEKLMLTLRDVTELRKLRTETAVQQKELLLIAQLLRIAPEAWQRYANSFNAYYRLSHDLVEGLSRFDTNSVEVLFRHIHTIKGESRLLGLTYVAEAAHEFEQYLAGFRDDEGAVQSWQARSALAELEKVEKSWLSYHELTANQLHGIFEDKSQAYSVDDNVVALLKDERVDAETRIEKYLEVLGTISAEQLLHMINDAVTRTARQMNKMIPHLVSKVDPELRIKKEKLLSINGIMTHLVTNALDHGIEDIEERVKRGAVAYGSIFLDITLKDECIEIRFADDGRGLDLYAISCKLHELKGSSPSMATVEERHELAHAIFSAGLSTKKNVDQFSGRGVGLDAVKKMIEEEQGSIGIELGSEIEKGRYKFSYLIVIPVDSFVAICPLASRTAKTG
jgi:predicted ATPase/HPt (histidine-containing phosphotransfer) domain-containing protein